jgi:hypothetical protein
MLARHRDGRVTPVEVWDLLVGGVPLHRHERGPDFGVALGRAAEVLASGAGVTESRTPLPPACTGIRRVVLAGGGATAVRWRSDVLPAEHAAEPERHAEHGGLQVLARLGRRGLVVDLGQSRLKLAWATGRLVYARDFEAIPVSEPPADGRGRDALIAFVAGALREAVGDEPPEAIILGLPCAIDDDCLIGTCTYPWSAGDSLVPELLEAAGLGPVPTWLVNDAELAAIGLADQGLAQDGTLVLTVGFGVGGALVGETT